jgi:PKD repeat protein
MGNGITRLSVLCIGLALGVGCTVHDTEVPPLTGPSEFATSIRVTATPDTINQDGASQSAIVVTAIDASGKAASGLPMRLDILVSGVPVDFGTLSARNVVTGSDGRANVVYTAPRPPSPGAGGGGTQVSILAVPNGSDANVSLNNGALAQIRLVPPGIILPPAGTPTASFRVSPTPLSMNVEAIFDASGSTPGSNSGGISSYFWTFGDGDDSTQGPIANHKYAAPGTYTVTLTVTNDRGVSASTTQTVTVSILTAPTAAFVFSPTTPKSSDIVQFNAIASQAAAGHSIVSYQWDFGDPVNRFGTGATTTHQFSIPGGLTDITYNVTLTVTDDTGQKATATQAIKVVP